MYTIHCKIKAALPKEIIIMGELTQKYLKPIKTKSVVQQVVDRLTQALINKELRPGDKIPTEQELAATFGAARNSVREAIKILVSFGVLEIRRPEGTFVTNGFTDAMINPLLYGIILDDVGSMDSLMELREWNDFGMLRLAIDKATPSDIELLEKCLVNLKKQFEDNNFEGIFLADDEFHETLALITHNSLFGKICHITRLLTTSLRYKTITHMLRSEKSAEELYKTHVEVLNVIKNKDIQNAEHIIRQSYFYDEGALDG